MIRYRCPSCKTFSSEMDLIRNDYTPTEEQIKRDPQLAEMVRGEVLRCKCRMLLTWFILEEVEFVSLTEKTYDKRKG